MIIIEQKLVGKFDDEARCEDSIVVTEQYIAVIDGATAKSSVQPNTASPGKVIAVAIAEYLTETKTTHYGVELVSRLSEFVRRRLLRPIGCEKPSVEAPSASLAVYSRDARRITVVGDIAVMIGENIHRTQTPFDVCMSQTRSIVNWMEIRERGSAIGDRNVDAGREFILQILRSQHLFRNVENDNPWAYGSIDGFPVPARFVVEYVVTEGQEVVLSSDGYPLIKRSLAEAEAALVQVLTEDPLRTLKYLDTKGMVPGQVSFDDRAYVRFIS
jgi:hypothetical protein